MFPLFLNLHGRVIVLVGDGAVADAKQRQLAAAGADVRRIPSAAFTPDDLDDAWLVVVAAAPAVNRRIADAARDRRLFVNAVDDPANATAFLSGVVRRGGVTVAISTDGEAPALTALLREALDEVLPPDLDQWMTTARSERMRWKRDAVPMDARKPLLLDALNKRYAGVAGDAEDEGRAGDAEDAGDAGDAGHAGLAGDAEDAEDRLGPAGAAGHVSLVGAGPGDPGLLTRTAIARLRAADLVLYDALVDRRVLRYARRAQKFFVGKRAARCAMPQHRIEAVMIRAARRGRRVVRLKGGDPFVFGRGGEEALALRRAGVPYDVVPGVTSAVAAPAAAGIPVTHRGAASAFLVVSGHDERAFADAIGCARPGTATVVILMGVGRAAALACTLVDRGWRRSTPAAIVVDGTTSRQRTWRGTLDDLASDRAQIDGDGPGTIVLGEVVAVGTSLAQALAPVERVYVGR